MAKSDLISDTRRYRLLYDRYKLLALNMFEWEGLPPTIKPRHIELALFNRGKCLFFEDKSLGIGVTCLPCDYSSNFNIYGEGQSYIVNGFGYSNVFHKADNVVLMLNNDLGTPTYDYVDMYARKMSNVEFSIDMNIRQQRIPWIVETTRDNKYSMELAFDQILSGKLVVYANKELGINNSNVISLNTPFVALQLNEYKYELEREILTFLGLNNTVEKKERLIIDEVNSNNDFIEQNVEIMYRNRLDACKMLNDVFGWNVSVKKTSFKENEGGEENGEGNVGNTTNLS